MCRKAIIDRFEEDFAVLEMEDGQFVDISRDTLPPEAREGSVILIDEEGKLMVLEEETKSREDEVREIMDRLFE